MQHFGGNPILSPEGALPRPESDPLARFRFVPCPAVPAALPFHTVPFRPGSGNSVSCPFRFVSFRGVVSIAFPCRSVSAYGVSRFIHFVPFHAEPCWGVPFRFVSPVPCRSISFRFGCSSDTYINPYTRAMNDYHCKMHAKQNTTSYQWGYPRVSPHNFFHRSFVYLYTYTYINL